jgi:hypothetical protein
MCKLENYMDNGELKVVFYAKLDELKIYNLYSIYIKIPKLKQYGDLNNCNICFDEVNEKNKYITPCGHLFHINCIFTYFKSNHLLENINCSENCCNTMKIKQYECIVCRYKIKK